MMRYEYFYVHTYIIYRDIYKYQVDIYLKQHYHAHSYMQLDRKVQEWLRTTAAGPVRGWLLTSANELVSAATATTFSS